MIEETIKKIIFDKFKLEVSENTNVAEFVEDSMAKIEMLFEIEQALGRKFDEEDLLSIETVGDIFRIAKKS